MICAGSQATVCDNSVEAVERFRLECLCKMLQAMGLKTSLAWRDTQYTLTIMTKSWWPKTLQVLTREITTAKPPAEQMWLTDANIYAKYTFATLDRAALKDALDCMNITLHLDDPARAAVAQFSEHLALGRRVFPVQHWDDDDEKHIFWVVGEPPLPSQETVAFFKPGIEIRLADLAKYQHIRKYLNLYLEWYFGIILPPNKGGFIGCDCLDSIIAR